jgi:ubiquinone/menaquinone biosynthesis C-methylase UbiE
MSPVPLSPPFDLARPGTTTDAFSLYAPTYDSEQAINPIARWSRRRNLAVLERAFPAGSRVLELGCGTGEEAIHLARRGVSVVATDAAPGMISVLRDKLSPDGEAHDVSGRVETLILPASQLATLRRERPDTTFDGAYSSFGPLNCEPDLQGTLDELARLVKPGGRVVISILTKYCLWETAWYLLHGDFKSAFRRWGGATQATVRDEWRQLRVPVYYWSTRRVRRVARPYFDVERQMALPWLLPPQYLAGLVARFPRAFRLLARIDRKLAAAWPFYTLGDHYLVVLVRRGD